MAAHQKEAGERRIGTMRFGGSVCLVGVAAYTRIFGCHSQSNPIARQAGTTATDDALNVVDVIYEAGLKNEWHDSGTASRETAANGPAKIRFDHDGEWILAKTGLTGDFGGLAFRMRAPPGEGDFLEVRVDPRGGAAVRPVKVSPSHRTDLGDGWKQVVIPMDQLDPGGAPIDRIVFRSFRPFGQESVLFDKVYLTKATARSAAAAPPPFHGKRSLVRFACDTRPTKISRFIYGVAGLDAGHMPVDVGATVYRWGGNGTSRYNWERHVGNLTRDWFYENHESPDYAEFLEGNVSHGASTALTVPILGWVAKDATSYSFPVSVFGRQGKTDPSHPDIGDGTTPAGANIPPGPPSRTSVAAPPEWIAQWIAAITAKDAQTGRRSVYEYILDNEPMLWSTTHRDVSPQPLGYDELLDRTIRYGTAIRRADPAAVIAGPAEWGWANYFYSSKDAAAGFRLKPDRRTHDDVPLVEWYLRKLREHAQRTGVRVLDVLDMHYYPQANKVYSAESDPTTVALRLRSTRSLWDPSYVDESWIHEPIRLLPRMKEWVEKNYPGRGISIGEWNFGGELDMSGALATAEALGRFAQFGVASAFYWTVPPAGSPTVQGFLAYRNFDGKGGHFLDWYISTSVSGGVSVFASRDEPGAHVVALALNVDPDDARASTFDLSTCGPVVAYTAHVYAAGGQGFAAREPVQVGGTTFDEVLAPRSITVLDIELAQPLPTRVEQ